LEAVDSVQAKDSSIIYEPTEDVTVYLKYIDLLWKLGRKPYHRGSNP